MKRGQSQECSVRPRPLPTKLRRNVPSNSEKISLLMEAEQAYFIKFFLEEGMKGMQNVTG
jgi:hypothetical protein